jgi:hypothetical protein
MVKKSSQVRGAIKIDLGEWVGYGKGSPTCKGTENRVSAVTRKNKMNYSVEYPIRREVFAIWRCYLSLHKDV